MDAWGLGDCEEGHSGEDGEGTAVVSGAVSVTAAGAVSLFWSFCVSRGIKASHLATQGDRWPRMFDV